MNIDAQRHRLKRRMENEGLSLRTVGEHTGISFATLSRFNREIGELTMKNALRLKAWLDGEPIPSATPVATRRFKVGPATFLITIELINSNEVSND